MPKAATCGAALPKTPMQNTWQHSAQAIRHLSILGCHGNHIPASMSLAILAHNMPLGFEIIPGRWIGREHPCFIIAEIGQNHQGDVNIAKKMVEAAKSASNKIFPICDQVPGSFLSIFEFQKSGADCVKFQKSDLKEKFTSRALQRPYIGANSWGQTYGEHKQYLELSQDEFRDLQSFSKKIGIAFTASGMDQKSLDFLIELDVPFLKIGSGDTNNFPLVIHAAQSGKPLVISSGMQSLETLKSLNRTIKPINDKFCFLQCTSCYPTSPKDVNLRVIQTLRREFKDVPIGYSGHEVGTCISVTAVALGAKVIERHLTLDKTWKGSDHSSSLLPEEFQQMVTDIRIVESSLGQNTKIMLECEYPCYNKLGKSLVAACAIPQGTTINEKMLAVKVSQPKGLSPELMAHVIGKIPTCDIPIEECIQWKQFE